MKMKLKSLSCAIALASATALSGCAWLAPSYQRPAYPVSDNWATGIAGQAPSGKADAAQTPWHTFFTDKKLQHLIEIALQNNRDLRIATLNVEKTQQMYRIARADLFPTIGVGPAASQSNQSAAGGEPGSVAYPGSHSYSAGLGISSYELDLWGRVASLKDQALESYFAQASTQQSAKIALIANVANAYMNLIADREHLKVARDTLKSQSDSYQIIKTRFDHGIASELDLRQAQVSVETARVDLASYTTTVSQDVNALVLLLGTKQLPEAIVAENVDSLDKMPALKTTDISSTVLLKRPDIIAAEHQLKAATANIGAARAAFFPKISLTTTAGTASTQLSDLFDAHTGVWNFVTNITMPIFDMGRNWSNLQVAKIDQKIAVAQYEQAIQSAFKEVSDALAQRATIDEQLAAQGALFNATQESHRLAMLRYTKGVDSYLNVLDAERSMYSAHQGLVSLQLAKQVNQITLYKALGGGLK
jgi:multidrug efflux system outer membrane protein